MATLSFEDDCPQCTLYIERIRELESLLDISAEEILIDDSILDLSYDRIVDIVDKYYTQDLFNQGQKGIVSFIYSYIVRNDKDRSKILYTCIDQQKKIFQYRTEKGNQKDTRCKNLLDVLYDPLIKKVNKIYRISINKIYEEEKKNTSIEDDLSDDYDSDIEEVIASELYKDKPSTDELSIDDVVNATVDTYLEIKKCCKNRKLIVDELSQMLYL